MNLQAADTVIIFDTDWNPQANCLTLALIVLLELIMIDFVGRNFPADFICDDCDLRLICKRKLELIGLDRRKMSLFLD